MKQFDERFLLLQKYRLLFMLEFFYNVGDKLFTPTALETWIACTLGLKTYIIEVVDHNIQSEKNAATIVAVSSHWREFLSILKERDIDLKKYFNSKTLKMINIDCITEGKYILDILKEYFSDDSNIIKMYKKLFDVRQTSLYEQASRSFEVETN